MRMYLSGASIGSRGIHVRTKLGGTSFSNALNANDLSGAEIVGDGIYVTTTCCKNMIDANNLSDAIIEGDVFTNALNANDLSGAVIGGDGIRVNAGNDASFSNALNANDWSGVDIGGNGIDVNAATTETVQDSIEGNDFSDIINIGGEEINCDLPLDICD